MKDPEIFDEYVTHIRRGRRLNGAEFPATANDAYARYVGRARAAIRSANRSLPKLPTMYADFVTNPQFNAFAFRHQGRYFIAFHAGLPIILTTVMYRMLADTRLFPDVGDPRTEASNLPHFQQLSPNATLLSSARPEIVVPKDDQRHIYAIHLCHLVFDFLTAHEIAHIANGHIDYKKAERGISYLEEVQWVPSTPEGNLEMQALELDADATAARVLVKTIKALFSSRDQMLPEIATFYQTPSIAMFDMAVAVCVMFRLFQDSRMNGVDLSKDSHPPMRWRQMQILNMMGNCLDQSWDSSLVPSVETAFTKAIADVEEAFELITGTAQQVQGLHDAWLGEGWAYAATVTDCWNSIVRAKVAKYAFIEPSSYHFDRPGPQ